MPANNQFGLSRRGFIRDITLSTVAVAAGQAFLSLGSQSRAELAGQSLAKRVSYLKTKNGKTIVVVNERPYLMYGVQIRLDWLMPDFSEATWAKAQSCFEHASTLGFKTVSVPVYWSHVEPTEGVYQYANYLDKIIDNAKAHGLYLQILWFGSDVCGWNDAPQYVQDDKVRFPRLAKYDNFLDLTNPKLIDKEKAALAAMMSHIASYDTSDRVVMIQVENEPDGAGAITTTLKVGR